MEGFSLAPSEPVWEKIERQIPQQTRRRRFIAFIFLFTGLMVCGYFYYNKWSGAAQELNHKPTNLAAVTEEKNNTGEINGTKETIYTNTLTQQPFTLQQEKIIRTRDINTAQKNTSESVAATQKNNPLYITDELNTTEKQDHSLPVLVDTVSALYLQSPVNIDIETKNNFNEQTVLAEGEILKAVTGNYTIAESETTVKQLEDTTKTIVLKDSLLTTTAAKKQTVKINIPKKWQFGISGFYGSSDVTESFLGIGSSAEKSADYTSGGNTGGLNQYNFNVSKQVKAKGAFSLGLGFKKQLNRRSSFITGVQYTKLNTQIETGTRKDSSAVFEYNNTSGSLVTRLENFYTTGSGSTYINSYHLLQIPLIFEQRINSSKNLIFNWNAGLSISRLLSSNALVFDYGNQAFYNNNELFRKTQVTMLAGLNMQFALSKKSTLNLGPQLEYSLQNLLHNKSYGSQHFINYGVKANIFFSK